MIDSLKPWMPKYESGFERILEPYGYKCKLHLSSWMG